MYAIVETGGKQYRVEEGSKIIVEKLPNAVGSMVTLDHVLLLSDKDEYIMRKFSATTIGQRLVNMGLTPRHTRRGHAYRLVVL